MIQEHLLTLRSLYRDSSLLLTIARNEAFPLGSVVCSTRGRLWGIIVQGSDQPNDKIAILFENGNTWFRDFDEFTVCGNRRLWPKFICRMKRKKIA